ncbi:DUF2938 family protein [Cutibacterium equinum]|uniref:DUF2938 family protein n=1 Tax=Cutibacterium equinum TaxID=3016342 RepID=A0ABY7QY04_9ACTN|nr:DUF2938 family protein [Cutibacterium equinum]WCC79304.1 DUF2938 family protein [Cutibacterium equinum]
MQVMRIGVGELVQAAVVGVGATLVMDAVAEVLRRTRGTRSLDYALVGRWLGHMPEGVFQHDPIMAAEPVPYEKALGWAAHYAIGTGFALALAVADPDWLKRPRFVPAVAWGLGAAAAPCLLMQPCFGMGVAASLANPCRIAVHEMYYNNGSGKMVYAGLVRGYSWWKPGTQKRCTHYATQLSGVRAWKSSVGW